MSLRHALMVAIGAAGVALASIVVSTSVQAVTFGNPQNPPPTLNNIPKEDNFDVVITSPFPGFGSGAGTSSWTVHKAVGPVGTIVDLVGGGTIDLSTCAGGCSGIAPLNIGGNGIDTAPTIDARPARVPPGPWANDSTANTEVFASSTFNAGETSSVIFGGSWFSFANTGFRDGQTGGGEAQVVAPSSVDTPAGNGTCTDSGSTAQRNICDQQDPVATWMFDIDISADQVGADLGLWVYADDTAEVYLSGPGLTGRQLMSLAADEGQDGSCSGGGVGDTPDQIGCQPGEFSFVEAFDLEEGLYTVEFEVFQFGAFELGLLYTGGLIFPVPEPTTIAIFGAGLLGLGVMRRRRRRDAA